MPKRKGSGSSDSRRASAGRKGGKKKGSNATPINKVANVTSTPPPSNKTELSFTFKKNADAGVGQLKPDPSTSFSTTQTTIGIASQSPPSPSASTFQHKKARLKDGARRVKPKVYGEVFDGSKSVDGLGDGSIDFSAAFIEQQLRELAAKELKRLVRGGARTFALIEGFQSDSRTSDQPHELRDFPVLCTIRDLINSSDSGALTTQVTVHFMSKPGDSVGLAELLFGRRTEEGSPNFIITLGNSISATLKYGGGGADRINLQDGSMLRIDGRSVAAAFEAEGEAVMLVFRDSTLPKTPTGRQSSKRVTFK